MTTWLYAASEAKASDAKTLALALESGFIWRPFYNKSGNAIACVRHIRRGDDIVLGYRDGATVRLLARFRVGTPDQPLPDSIVFGKIPAVWNDEFRQHGYSDDPRLDALVGVFVEEGEPLSGRVAYTGRNALSRLTESRLDTSASADLAHSSARPTHSPTALLQRIRPPAAVKHLSTDLHSPDPGRRDGVHVGIDVGGQPAKGFELCITEWVDGQLKEINWECVPHATPLPATALLRPLARAGDVGALASATVLSACATAATLWCALEHLLAAGVNIDSPFAFSRNRIGHGRLCEKCSLTGVTFQSTPSIACGKEHGGDWGWLVYGMIAFAACLHRGVLSADGWADFLAAGASQNRSSHDFVLRECFPTATISVLRERGRSVAVSRILEGHRERAEVEAVLRYLEQGVKAVKRPHDRLYDRADALVAAFGGLPYVVQGFREVPNWPGVACRWNAASGAEEVEGTFVCVE